MMLDRSAATARGAGLGAYHEELNTFVSEVQPRVGSGPPALRAVAPILSSFSNRIQTVG